MPLHPPVVAFEVLAMVGVVQGVMDWAGAAMAEVGWGAKAEARGGLGRRSMQGRMDWPGRSHQGGAGLQTARL